MHGAVAVQCRVYIASGQRCVVLTIVFQLVYVLSTGRRRFRILCNSMFSRIRELFRHRHAVCHSTWAYTLHMNRLLTCNFRLMCFVQRDEGGASLSMDYRWTTFLKSRLNCSLNAVGSETPYYFNEICELTVTSCLILNTVHGCRLSRG
jgi:Sema domain